MYDSSHMKCPEQAKALGHSAGQCHGLAGGGEPGKMSGDAHRYEFPLRVSDSVLEVDRGGGCPTL